MSIVACFALSSDPNLLSKYAFSSGRVTGYVGETNIETVQMEVGLTHVYTNDFVFGPRVFRIGEMCTGQNLGIPLTSLDECNKCEDASTGLVLTMIMGLITYLPTIFSNFNRFYYNYDVNCQKVFGSLIPMFGMFMSLYTWQGYANQCFGTFFDGEVTVPVLVPAANTTTGEAYDFQTFVNENPGVLAQHFSGKTPEELQALLGTEALDLEEIFNQTFYGDEPTEVMIARVNFDWTPGTGLILIVVATFIKLIDIINNFLLKTPSITRDLQEQLDYDKKYGGENAAEGGDGNHNEDDKDKETEPENAEEGMVATAPA